MSHYTTLGVGRDASVAEIKEKYHELALKYHPDKNLNNKVEAEEEFKKIADAYRILLDAEKRAEYDSSLSEEQASAAQAPAAQASAAQAPAAQAPAAQASAAPAAQASAAPAAQASAAPAAQAPRRTRTKTPVTTTPSNSSAPSGRSPTTSATPASANPSATSIPAPLRRSPTASTPSSSAGSSASSGRSPTTSATPASANPSATSIPAPLRRSPTASTPSLSAGLPVKSTAQRSPNSTKSGASSKSTKPQQSPLEDASDKPQVVVALALIDKAIKAYNKGSNGSDSEKLKTNIETILSRMTNHENKSENSTDRLRAIRNALVSNRDATKLLNKLKENGITVASLNESLGLTFNIFEKITSAIKSIGIESSPSFFAAGFYKDSRNAQFKILKIIDGKAKTKDKLKAIHTVLTHSPNATRLIGGLKERGITSEILEIYIRHTPDSTAEQTQTPSSR